MAILLADYEDERDCFTCLLEPDSRETILLLRGESGMGKTTFLSSCLQKAADASLTDISINVELRGSAVTVSELFVRIGREVSWERLPTFEGTVRRLGGTKIEVVGNKMLGKNQISVALGGEGLTDREERRAVLTDALFADLDHLDLRLLLICMDTFEGAATEVKDWIAGPFLARAAKAPSVRTVIAGREVPSGTNIEWGGRCVTRVLPGVQNPEHWMPVVLAMGRDPGRENALDWLAGVCDALEGNCSEIMKMIESLPAMEMHA